MTNTAKRRKSLLNSWELAGTALLAVFILRLWVFFPAPVLSSSMEPTLRKGEWVLAMSYKSIVGLPSAGDIIALQNSPGALISFKRVLALPGSIIPQDYQPEFSDLSLQEKDYFVVGDHLQESIDSRHYGPVNAKNIYGRALLVFWPLNSIRWIDHNA
jgi:signal peptidase I